MWLVKYIINTNFFIKFGRLNLIYKLGETKLTNIKLYIFFIDLDTSIKVVYKFHA